jgi:hypothetical protein
MTTDTFKRYPIAITTGGRASDNDIVYVVCDDGSIWEAHAASLKFHTSASQWKRIPNIPDKIIDIDTNEELQ